MESTKETAENKCSCPNNRNATSYCNKCKLYICKDCHVLNHIDHDSEVIDLAEKTTKFLGEYQKLSSAVNLISDRRQIHIKQESIKDIIEELKMRLIKTKKEFQEDIKKSLDGTLNYLPTSPLVKEFERKKMELGGEPDNPVDKLREELARICLDLLHKIMKDQYVSADKFLSSMDLKKYQEELERINELSSGDMDYIQELGKLKRTNIEYSYNPMTILGMIRVNTEVKKPDRVIQFDREKNSLNIYNIKTKSSTSTQVNSGFILPYRFISIEVASNVYLVGGDNNHGYYLKSIHLYDEIRGVLIALAEMFEARSRHSLSSHKDSIFAIGGENSTGVLNSCEQYDIKENVWKTFPRLHQRRCGHSSCVVDGHLYVGFGWDGEYLNSIESLNIEYGTAWSIVKLEKGRSLPALQIAGMIHIGTQEILVFGGYEEGEKLSTTSFVVNLKKNTWKKMKELAEGEAFIGSEAKKMGEMIYSVGYVKGGLYSYDIRRDVWNFTEQEKAFS